MGVNRLFGIVYHLINNKTATAGELSKIFEVSPRTILRDIDSLAESGVPVFTMQGHGGGIAITENFVLNKTILSPDEQHQIMVALKGIASTQHINTESATKKLGNFFPKTDTSWIEVDFSRWGSRNTDTQKFHTIKSAILNKTPISFIYSNSNGETLKRKTYPIKLVYKSNDWYLQAYCLQKEGYRTFKINRIRQLEVLPESFQDIQLSPPNIDYYDMNHENVKKIKLLFQKEAAFRVYDEFYEENVVKNHDGSFSLTYHAPIDQFVYGYILSFGTLVEVIEPMELRNEIIRMAENIKSKYF